MIVSLSTPQGARRRHTGQVSTTTSAPGQFTGSRVPDPDPHAPLGQFVGDVSTVVGASSDVTHPTPALFTSTEPVWNPADISDDVFDAPIFQQAAIESEAGGEIEREGVGAKAARGAWNLVAIIVFTVVGLAVAGVVVGYLAVTVGPWTVLRDGSVISRSITDGPINALPAGSQVVVSVGEPAVRGVGSLVRPVQPATALATITSTNEAALGQQVSYAATCDGDACPSPSITVEQSAIVGQPDVVAQLPTWLTDLITGTSTR